MAELENGTSPSNSVSSSEPLRILVADDAATDRFILESIVSQAGHVVLGVENGKLAIEAFHTFKPDIILLDVLMPVMGGIEAAQHLRELTQSDVIPILFLTSLTDSESLVECLEAGGDDFIPKPYNRTVLQSKIKSFGRLRYLHLKLAEQKAQIEAHNVHLIQEQTVAKQVFDKIAHGGCLDLEVIKYYMSPLAVFNGDVLVAEIGPDGNLLLLLGDFTGHGLPAAIGSLPLATTFYGMVRKGFAMPEILREINQKLHDILPIGFFCCALCADINFKKKRVRVWNGGLPDSFLYRKSTDTYEQVSSKNLPLGVLSSRDFQSESKRFEIANGDKLYIWSDGVLEARNKSGEMFGEQRLSKIMDDYRGSEALFDQVLSQVHEYIGRTEKDDDVSLVEVNLVDHHIESYIQSNADPIRKGNLADWSMSFRLEANTLRNFDPLPMVLNIADEVPGLRKHRSHLYTILSELMANALEHGVLKLESSLKQEPDGFTRFYDLRRERLQALVDGFVQLELHHRMNINEMGGTLVVKMIDSGKGFDFVSKLAALEADDFAVTNFYHGRGLALLKSLCSKLTIDEPGNSVTVTYDWDANEH